VVAYKYTIMGRDYTGSRIAFGSNTFTRKKSEEIIARYPVGQPVMVHYNPDKLEYAVLEAEAQGGTASLVVGIIFIVVGVVMAAFSRLR